MATYATVKLVQSFFDRHTTASSSMITTTHPFDTDAARCHYDHDATTFYLSLFILVGLLASYLPQHYRIIASRSSEGFSPWFLLLGATSSASSLLNVVTLQWGVVRCCKYLSAGRCIESLLGILQVFAQWACFNIVLILFIIYFPRNKRYVLAVPVDPTPEEEDPAIPGVDPTDPITARSRFNPVTRASSRFLSRFFSLTSSPRADSKTGPSHRRATSDVSDELETSSDGSSFDPSSVLPPSATRSAPLILSPEYSLSIVLAFVVLLHLVFSACVTVGLLLALPKATSREPEDPSSALGSLAGGGSEHLSVTVLRLWASFNGLLSTILACAQYLPQIVHTARARLVGSLSVPMMCIQTPGSFVFVYSLAVRPGVNWTTWIVYLITGILQGCLLALCIAWKLRQSAMGIDDWGRDKHLSSILRREEAEAAYTPVDDSNARGFPGSVGTGTGTGTVGRGSRGRGAGGEGERRPLLGSQRSGRGPRGSTERRQPSRL